MDALPVTVNVAVVGVGADDAAMRTVIERLAALGHRVLGKQQLSAGAPLLELLSSFIEDAEVDVVVAVANETEPVRAALAPLVTRWLPGFGELLRAAAFSEIGSSAMLLDGEAARCGNTYVFVVPGTVGAAKAALEHLLIPQLDTRTRPMNLASKLPRLRSVPTDAFETREITDVGTPPPPTKTAAPPARTKTAPPPTPTPTSTKPITKTPPLGVVLRATPVEPEAATDAEMIRSDAAILIPPAEIVPEPAPPPAEPAAPEPAAAAADSVHAEQLGAFVMSLEQHAQKLRAAQSQVGPLPAPPSKTQPPPTKTQPPPIKRKTDAEMKADRDASVAEAISKVEPLPDPEGTPPKRKKNETTPQQWAKAAEDMEKISPRAARRDTGSLGPASAVLAQGDRVIVIPQHRRRRVWVWAPLALAIGIGGGLFVKMQFLSGNRTASAAAQPDEQVVKVEPVEAEPSPPAPAPQPLPPVAVPPQPGIEEPQEIDMDPGSAEAGNLTALAEGHRQHDAAHAPGAEGAHAAAGSAYASVAGSADASAAGSADGSAYGSGDAPDPRTHPNIAPASPDCDETSCILEQYKRECCARYKPAEPPPVPTGPPLTLDKAQVKAGIADLKPAVEQCGDQHHASGTVKVTLTVSPDGLVTATTVAATPLPELGDCVAKVLERATFAKTQSGAVFTYPFAF